MPPRSRYRRRKTPQDREKSDKFFEGICDAPKEKLTRKKKREIKRRQCSHSLPIDEGSTAFIKPRMSPKPSPDDRRLFDKHFVVLDYNQKLVSNLLGSKNISEMNSKEVYLHLTYNNLMLRRLTIS